MLKIKFIVLISFLTHGFLYAQQHSSTDIRLNQIGFYPNAPKVAVILKEVKGDFYIFTSDKKEKVFTGKLSTARQSEFSSKKTCIANFTLFDKPGKYVIEVPGVGNSYLFEIKAAIHQDVATSVIKGFYYQRVSTELPEKFAGKWFRAGGHPDNKVLIHPSAATNLIAANSFVSAPRGWYDAGDYNKYIVNSGITMGTLFSVYEDFPDYFKKQNLNIPESNNNVPDILDEALWNLRWMLSMQDPNDGGVYNKLTNEKFDAFIMPDKATAPRYVVQKGTAATLDFAAVTAQASRIFKNYSDAFPGLADSCLAASLKAWSWAAANPQVVYDQDNMNKTFDPDIITGGYGDNNFADEFIWAASELYATTHDEKFYASVQGKDDGKIILPSWSQVKLLGFYTLMRFEKTVSTQVVNDLAKVKKHLIDYANVLVHNTNNSSYNAVYGISAKDFGWGGNSDAANQGIVLIEAYRITKDKGYINSALTNIDYLLGRNGTGYSFVTGFGDKRVMHPHHRPSEADGVIDPIPGLLVGGANPGMQDKCVYGSTIPNEAYTDDVCSYASNEIAINWNAPAVYLLNAIEALQYEVSYSRN